MLAFGGFMKLPTLFLGLLFTVSAFSMQVPYLKSTNDVGEINKAYPAYLNFIVAASQNINPAGAEKLRNLYEKTANKDKKAAARLLKGIHFEITQKIEMSPAGSKNLSSQSPAMKQWVKKYLPLWIREADEQYFRANNPMTYKD